MDRGHSSGLHVVGDVAQNDAVLERKRKILGQRYPQAALDVLHNKEVITCRLAVTREWLSFPRLVNR